ncbi:hypothetical protein [Parasitella parasitica]|uniref:Reverse transcriptase domain-containing protein n=1 Tax=Parasitella parasitica TaxID=35722 RepID=A0A0B7MUF4_9FUNG|nr:hypothetical protein [Parasitella parasitica]
MKVTGKRCFKCGSLDWFKYNHQCGTAVRSSPDGSKKVIRMMTAVDDAVGPKIPDPIDPDSVRPNNDPYGTDVERAPYEKRIRELLVINSQIDMKNTCCNVPGSTIKLTTKPGCVAYRAQYPLPEAYREAVAAQIKTWLDEGVICRAKSHVEYNSPLLCVKKKNNDGEYTFEKPRVVCDVRQLNSILVVDDKQQLPLVSSIHERIGDKTIHSYVDIHAYFTSYDILPSDSHKVLFTCPFTNIQYSHLKSAYGIRHVGSVVTRTLQNLIADLNQTNPFSDDGNYTANTCCNLPGSTIKLTTKTGCVAYRAQSPLPEAYREAIAAQIETWIDEGVICRAKSHVEYNSPLLCVKKKINDGEYTFEKPRVVCNVRQLNSILVVDDKQQLPLISSIHERIGDKTIHSCLDIHACFTSYVTRTLQNLIADLNQTNTFSDDGNYTAVCYVDDGVLSSRGSLADHCELVSEVIRRLTKANLVLNPDKVVFAQQSIHLLGWSVVKGKLVPDPRKVANVAAWGSITTGKQLTSFLGLLSFFRSSIPCFTSNTRFGLVKMFQGFGAS